MAHFFLLGGWSEDTDLQDQDVKSFISDLFNGEEPRVWIDPCQKRRAVIACSSKHEIKALQDKLLKTPLNGKTLYIDEEDKTSIVHIKVPRMKCKALVDKLPWLFHQKKKDGSKVVDIRQKKENNFLITFMDGWDAVARAASDNSWFIQNTEINVVPYFKSFEEKFKDQKRRLTETLKNIENFEQRDLPNQQRHEGVREKDKISREMMKACEEQGIEEDQNCDKVKEQGKSFAEQMEVCDEQDVEVDGNSKKVKEQGQSFVDQMEVCDEQDVEVDGNCKKVKEQGQIVAEQMKACGEQGIREDGENEIAKTQSKDLSPQLADSTVGQSIKEILPSEKSVKEKKNSKKRRNKTVSVSICVDDNVYMFLHTWSLWDKIQTVFPNVLMNKGREVIECAGPESLVKKMEKTILGINLNIIKNEEFQLFFVCYCTHTLEHFKKNEMNFNVEETNDTIGIFIENEEKKKKSLEDFLKSEIHFIEEFPLQRNSTEKEGESLKRYLSTFNQRTSFKLHLSGPYTWRLLRLGCMADTAVSSPVKEIEDFLRETKESGVKVRPKVAPKPKVINLHVPSQSFLDLFESLGLSKNLQEQFRIVMELKNGEVTLRGRHNDVTQVKDTLISFFTAFDSKEKLKNHLAMYLEAKLIEDYFQLHMETVNGCIQMCISDKFFQRGNLCEFTEKVLNGVEVFNTEEIDCDRNESKEYVTKFNQGHSSFKLIVKSSQWFLLRLSFKHKVQEVASQIRQFLSEVSKTE